MSWLLTDGGLTDSPTLTLGTVDAWLIWNLTGGTDGGALVTDPTNASRTLLYDITTRAWSPELAGDLRGPPRPPSPRSVPPAAASAPSRGELAGPSSPLAGVPVSGVAGDQQAALFGQACFTPGMAKVTYGTGSFVLANIGPTPPPPVEGLLTTLAWDLGAHGGSSPVAYALEGAVFVTGAAVQWLRDGLGLIAESKDIGPLAASVPSTEGVYLVPAFTGLGSPYWDPYARGTITGLTKGTGAAHIARAVVEAMAFQVRDVVDAMTAGRRVSDRPSGWTAAPRLWTSSSSSRPIRSASPSSARPRPRPPPSGPPSWPAWPKGSGDPSTTSPPSGPPRPPSPRRPRPAPPTPPTPAGAGPSPVHWPGPRPEPCSPRTLARISTSVSSSPAARP